MFLKVGTRKGAGLEPRSSRRSPRSSVPCSEPDQYLRNRPIREEPPPSGLYYHVSMVQIGPWFRFLINFQSIYRRVGDALDINSSVLHF